jgi:Mor family transcriptional regulator
LPKTGRRKMEKDDIVDELTSLIGEEATDILIKNYSGLSIYIPRSNEIKRIHKEIIDEYKNGATYRELAIKHSYSDAHIRRIVHDKRIKKPFFEDDKQILFW